MSDVGEFEQIAIAPCYIIVDTSSTYGHDVARFGF